MTDMFSSTESLMSNFSQSSRSERTVSQSSDPVPLEADSIQTPVSALTRDQLKQALLHLLNVSY